MAIERQDPLDPNNTLIYDDRTTEAEIEADLVQRASQVEAQVEALRSIANPSKATQKQAQLSQTSGSKQQQVAETSERIKFDLNPQVQTLEKLREYANSAQNRLERDDRQRRVGEFAADAGIAAGRGAVRLGQSVLGTALPDADVSDVTENPYFQRAQAELRERGLDTVSQEELVQERLEQRSTLIKAMQDANKLIEGFNESQSLPLQARRFANQEELEAYRAERKAELVEKGKLTVADKVQTVTEEFFNTVAAYAQRPSLAIDLAFENVADIVITGGLGKALAVPREIAEGGAEAVAKWAATEAGQKELKKRATTIGVSTAAVQEGLGSQAQVTTEIEEMSHEDLVQNSPEYNNLLADGLSPEEAKARLQETAGKLAFGYSALFAGVSSRLSGGGEFSANLFNPASRVGKTLSNLAATARGATKEALEETGASGGSQLAGNIAKQQTVNESQDLTEGVGEAAATGAVAAGISGGASGAAANIVSATSSITDKAATAKKNRETKKKIEESGTEGVITDVNDPDFSIGGTLRGIAARNRVEGVTQEEKVQNFETASKVWFDYRTQIDTLTTAAEATDNETQKAELLKRAEELRTEGRRYANIMSQLQQDQVETNNVDEATQQVVEGDTTATERILGSILIDPSSLSDANADALLNSGNLDDVQRQAVEATREYNRATKSLEQVSTDIFEGGDGFRGLPEYQSVVSEALRQGDTATVDRYMSDLSAFVEQRENKASVARQALETTDRTERAELLTSINLNPERISARLVRDIEAEAVAVKATFDMLSALQGETNVDLDVPAADVTDSVPTDLEGEVDVQTTDDGTTAVDPSPVTTEATTTEELTTETEIGEPDDLTSTDLDSGSDSDPVGETTVESEPEYALNQNLTARRETATTDGDAKTRFQEGNVVRDKFVAVKREGATDNPLNKVRDYADVLVQNPDDAVNYLDNQESLTPEERRAIESFAEFAKDVDTAFDELVSDDYYAPSDYMHYLRDDEGNFEQNVKTAVALSMFNWMANKGGETRFNTWEDINSILGRQDEDYVGPELQRLLQNAGTLERNVVAELGRSVVQTLGIRAGADAGINAQTNLENSLGLFALDLLEEANLVEFNKVNQRELAEIIDSLDGTETADTYAPEAELAFVRMAEGEGVDAFREDSAGSRDVLGRLFKTESFRSGPVLDKPTKTVTRQKGTRQKVADKVQEILLKHSQREHYVKKNQQKLFSQMSDEQIATMLGFTDPATVQQYERDGVEGKNAQIMNSIKHWRDFYGELENDDQAFYFNWEQWKNQRVGIVSNTVNPQGDKLHRHLLYVGDQRQTISMDDTDLFLVGIAQGFGVSIDKQTDQMSRDELEELVQKPVFYEGIQEAVKMLQDQPFNMDKIMATIAEAGEAAHSMDALVAYAEYTLALRENRTEFETDYSIEGDGVTNGPAIASLQFAVGSNPQDTQERLKRVSINLDGDTEQFGEWKSNPLNDDNYQAIARDVQIKLGELPEAEATFMNMLVGELTAELEGTGSDVVTKAGRNLTKNPLMTAIYGSGEKSIKKAMGYMVLEKFYAKLGDSKTTDAEIDTLGELLGLPRSEVAAMKKDRLEYSLPRKTENFIVKVGSDVYGNAVYDAVNDNYASFMERRTTVNNMMKVVFDLYKAQRDILIEKKTQEAIEEGIIYGPREALPIRMLNEVEAELANAQPVLHSYFSAQSGNLNEGIFVGKTEMQVQRDSKFRTEAARKGRKGKRNVYGRLSTPIDGGVSPTVLAVQGTDAATMLLTLENAGVLNVHDAIFTGTANGLTDMESINRNFYNVMTDYSIVEQAYESMQRAVEQARKFDEENGTAIMQSEDFAESLNRINREFKDPQSAEDALAQFTAEANEAVEATRKGREETLSRITYMAQYYMENGGYYTGNKVESAKVTDTPVQPTMSYVDAYGEIKGTLRTSKKRLDNVVDTIIRKADVSEREDVKRMADAMVTFRDQYNSGTIKQALEVFAPEQLRAVVDTLNRFADVAPAPKSVQTENQAKVSPVDERVRKAVENSTDVDQLIDSISKFANTTERRVLREIRGLVPKGYKVEIYDARKHARYATKMADSKGLHDPAAKLILLGSDTHQWSGLSIETVSHELVHAALVQKLRDSNDPNVTKAKADLVNILAELKRHHSDKFGANSLENVDELIAWTLTSAKMQDTLADIELRYENRVKSALRWVGDILTSVFGSKNPKQNNALRQTLLAVQNVIDATTAESLFSGARFNTRDFTAQNTEQVSPENLTTTFDRLGSYGRVQESGTHSQYLRDLMGKLVGPVMTPVKLHLADIIGDTHGAITGEDVYIYTQMTGRGTALPSGVAARHGAKMSAQETFAHEMTHAVLREAIDGNSRAKRELLKLFRYVKQNKLVTVEDLMDNPQNGVNSEDYKNAKATYNYVMNIRTTSDPRTGKSAYLHEFAAYALTNKKFMDALSRNPVPKNVFSKDLVVAGDWVATVRNFFDVAMNYVTGRLSGLNQYMTVDEGVKTLALELAGVEAAHKHKLVQYADTVVNVVTERLTKFTEATRNSAQSMGNSNFIKNNRFRVVRTLGNVARWSYEGVTDFMEHLAQTKLHSDTGRQSFLGAMVTEAMGRTASTATFHDLSRRKNKLLDHDRKQIEANTAKALNRSFKRKLTDAEKVAITKAAIKTDLTTLWEYMDMQDIENVLSSNVQLEQEISSTLRQLGSSRNRGFYYRASQALGYYMATGNVYEAHTLLNAENIAKLVGVDAVPKDWRAHVNNIDKLATLYAIKYTSTEHKDALVQLIREDEHGVGFTLDMHKRMQEEDRQNLFDGDSVRFIKGYTRDLTDNNISVVQVSESEVADYEKQGYQVVRQLSQDTHIIDPEPVFLMVNKYGGANAYMAGIISLTSRKAKGSAQTEFDPRDIKASKRDDIQEMRRARRIDPTTQRGGQLLPNVNADGSINSYRYVMNDETKDTLLARHNNFDDVMGAMAAYSLDKRITPQLNREVIDALREDYNSANPEAFVEISARATDPVFKEYWATLPEETKQYVKEVWGANRMFVRRDVAPIVFGQRKLSAADLLDHEKAQRSWIREALVQFADYYLGPTAAGKLRKAEDMWKEFVAETKEFVVVKSGIVTMVNAISNTSQLFLEGMSLGNALKWQKEAYVEARRYRRHAAELFELEKIVELGYEPQYLARNRERIAELRNELATSPVGQLIEDGMLQSIIEDVELEHDTFSHKSQLTQKVEAMTTRLPGFIRKGAKLAYVSHDTQLFKLLNEAAQLSDFVSRYALYKHKTEAQGFSHNEAIGLAMDVFINYDMPTRPILQYLNDIGLLWFTKYYFRVQKQIIRNFRENTARNMIFNVLNALTGGAIPSVLDSILSPSTLAARMRLPDNPLDMVANSIVLRPFSN